MIKLVAVDLDDTLLNADLKISSKNEKAIEYLKRMGVKLILATGRPTPSVKKYWEYLRLDTPVISYQGAIVHDFIQNKKIFAKEVDDEIAKKVIKRGKDFNVHINIYIDDVWYIEKYNEKAKFYHELTGLVPIEVGKFEDFVSKPTTKLLYFDDHDYLLKIKEQVEEQFDFLSITFSKPYFLEFTNKEATKGNALKFLSEYYNLKKDEIMAVGDGANDISMINYAKIGVAMANGHPLIKEAADFITDSNENDGFAKAVEKVFDCKL